MANYYENIKKFVADKRAWLSAKIADAKNFIKKDFNTDQKIPESVDKKDLDFMNDAKKALLSEEIPLVKILIYALVVFILIALIWARFAVIEEVTVGTGKVIPSSHVKSIQSLDGGILTELTVKQGEIVKQNQVIAKLSVSDFQADYLATKNHYRGLLATEARLEAEAENKNVIQFPAEIANDKELTKYETDLFLSRQKTHDERLQTLRENLSIAKKQLNIMQPLVREGVVSRLEFLQLQNNIATLSGNIKDEENKFHKETLTDLNKAKDEINSLQEKLIGLQNRITRSTLLSPVYGIVKQINVNTIGGVIKPGAELMQIVPLEDSLLIEAKITPKDIAFIRPNQKAIVKFTAYDYSIYGSLEGKVVYISADTVVDERGDMFYLVHVRTNRSFLGTNEKLLPIMPGMVAIVDIQTGKKTISDYLLKPILKAKNEALRER